jgi:hypothetical protein
MSLELEVTEMHVVMHYTVPLHALQRGWYCDKNFFRLGLADTIPRTKSIYQNGKKGLFNFIVLTQSQIIMLINEVGYLIQQNIAAEFGY